MSVGTQPPVDSVTSCARPPSPNVSVGAQQETVLPACSSPTTKQNEEKEEEKLKELRKNITSNFLKSFDHLLDRLLSDAEWSQFVARSDTMLDELGKLKAVRPPRNPTTHWKRRQRRSDRQSSNTIRSRLYDTQTPTCDDSPTSVSCDQPVTADNPQSHHLSEYCTGYPSEEESGNGQKYPVMVLRQLETLYEEHLR